MIGVWFSFYIYLFQALGLRPGNHQPQAGGSLKIQLANRKPLKFFSWHVVTDWLEKFSQHMNLLLTVVLPLNHHTKCQAHPCGCTGKGSHTFIVCNQNEKHLEMLLWGWARCLPLAPGLNATLAGRKKWGWRRHMDTVWQKLEVLQRKMVCSALVSFNRTIIHMKPPNTFHLNTVQ